MACFCWLFISLVGIGTILCLIKLYLKLTIGIYKGNEKLYNKTAVITGANSGIGFEAAKDLAKRGARIIMVCRNIEKAKHAKEEIILASGNSKIFIKKIDFASLESVRKCAKEIITEEKRIDILVNNAGESGFGVCITEDGLERVMQSNHYGAFLFTNILLDKIIKSSPSRIINTSSLAYVGAKLDFELMKNFKQYNYKDTTYNQFVLYANSKLANIYFTKVLAEKLINKGVTVNCLHPGIVYTDFLRYGKNWMKVVQKILCLSFFKNAQEGAQTTIYLCVSPDVENVTGEYFVDCKRENLWKFAEDKGAAKKMWEISEDAVKLQPNEIFY